MKQSLLIAAAFLVVAPLTAQITLGSSDFVHAGDSVRVSYSVNGTGNVDQTLTGANYLWDFSSLQPGAQQMLRYAVPTAIPFNFLSDIAVLNPTPDSLPLIGSVPTDFTDYFKNSNSSFRQNGLSFTYAPLGNFSVPVIFSASDYIYRFPMNHGNMDTSNAHYSFNIPNLLYFGQDIHRENNVDGWGTLITPYGTFQCLRLVSYVQRIDTIGIDSVNGFSNPRPLEIQYKWLAAGMKIPVLEVDAQVIASTELVTNVIYQDSLRSNVFQVGINEAETPLSFTGVYPNPASGQCMVAYQLSEPAAVSIGLYDLSGREVKAPQEYTGNAGNHTETLDLEGLAPGLYQVRIVSGKGLITSPLIITN